MNLAKNFVSRIKWKSVAALIVIVALSVLIVRNMPESSSISADISLDVKTEPRAIASGGESTLVVEVENHDKENSKTIILEAKTFDEKLLFDDTWKVSKVLPAFNIGPGESRKFRFKIRSGSGATDGVYTIEVKAVSVEDRNVKPAVDRTRIEIDSEK